MSEPVRRVCQDRPRRAVEGAAVRMELQQKEGELVDRARAIALVFRLARQQRDVWLGWPALVASLMAAELGIGAHALQTVLETRVREHLGSLAEVRPEFG